MDKKFQFLAVCLLLGMFLSACAPGQSSRPTSAPTAPPTLPPTLIPTQTPVPSTSTPEDSSKEEGRSFETAIVVLAASQKEGLDKENQWLDEHYPGYQIMERGVSLRNGKVYDLIRIKMPDGSELTTYFDITDFFMKP